MTAKADARAMVVKGHDVLQALKERGPLTDWQQRWLDEMEADLRTTDRGK